MTNNRSVAVIKNAEKKLEYEKQSNHWKESFPLYSILTRGLYLVLDCTFQVDEERVKGILRRATKGVGK